MKQYIKKWSNRLETIVCFVIQYQHQTVILANFDYLNRFNDKVILLAPKKLMTKCSGHQSPPLGLKVYKDADSWTAAHLESIWEQKKPLKMRWKVIAVNLSKT